MCFHLSFWSDSQRWEHFTRDWWARLIVLLEVGLNRTASLFESRLRFETLGCGWRCIHRSQVSEVQVERLGLYLVDLFTLVWLVIELGPLNQLLPPFSFPYLFHSDLSLLFLVLFDSLQRAIDWLHVCTVLSHRLWPCLESFCFVPADTNALLTHARVHAI